MITMYKIEGRPLGEQPWVTMAAGPFTYPEALREIERRKAAYNTSFLSFEYRAEVIGAHAEPTKAKRRALRRDLKEGTVFKYLSGWHKDRIYEAGSVHPGRPPLHQLGLWDSHSLPLSVQSKEGGDLCEILWEPEDKPAAAPMTPASSGSPAATAFPQAVAPVTAYRNPHSRRFLGIGTPSRAGGEAAQPEYSFGTPGRSLRPDLEEMPDEKLARLAAEAHAENERRRIQREERQRISEHNRRVEWLANHGERARGQFCNFMLGVAQAMACRTALRKYKGHLPYHGKNAAGGEMWRGDELAQAQMALGGYVAPWSVKADRFKVCILGKDRQSAAWRLAIGLPAERAEAQGLLGWRNHF